MPRRILANHDRPVDAYSSGHRSYGRTASGAIRKRCGAPITLGGHHRAKTACAINKDIVKDLVNRGALNAILRKLEIAPICERVALNLRVATANQKSPTAAAAGAT